jgi:hypothetical protein
MKHKNNPGIATNKKIRGNAINNENCSSLADIL